MLSARGFVCMSQQQMYVERVKLVPEADVSYHKVIVVFNFADASHATVSFISNAGIAIVTEK